MDRSEPAYCVIPGAGSSGLAWAETIELLGATLLEVPDASDVARMAAALAPQLRERSAHLVVVGASLGAMVALELSRTVRVDALVLIAAGFGIEVSDSLLNWIAANPPDLLEKVARASIADPEDEALVALLARDFASRGQPVLLRHLTALGSYRPQPLEAPPPTLVIWGEGDRSVPLADHVELARQCRGAVAPMGDAGHVPYLEQPAETVRWIRTATQLSYLTSEERTSNGQRHDLSDLT